MWLRDSSAQVRNYLAFSREDADLRALLKGVIAMEGTVLTITDGASISGDVPQAFMQIGTGYIGIFPIPVIVLFVVAIVAFVLMCSDRFWSCNTPSTRWRRRWICPRVIHRTAASPPYSSSCCIGRLRWRS